MESITVTPDKIELTDEANELFQRVWKRVMPDSQESPILVNSSKYSANETNTNEIHTEYAAETSLPNKELLPLHMQDQSNQMAPNLPMTEPIRTELANMDEFSPCHCKNDFPPRSAVPCLGSQNIHYEKLLQIMIRKEIQNWIYYRTLARRAGGSAARVFASMASDDLQNAKRLSAAYFLISGVHFWPERGGTPIITSYLSALRERFIDEQQDAAHYVAVATEASDPCLSQLLIDIAEDNLRHAYQIRVLIEQL